MWMKDTWKRIYNIYVCLFQKMEEILRTIQIWIRLNRVVRAMPKSQQFSVQSQHPPTQLNLRGDRRSPIEHSTKNIRKVKKIHCLRERRLHF
jgi:hypothetical protein